VLRFKIKTCLAKADHSLKVAARKICNLQICGWQNTQLAKISLHRGLIKTRLAQTQRNARKSKIRGLQNQAAAFKSEFKLLEF